jgi:hypothetical protein
VFILLRRRRRWRRQFSSRVAKNQAEWGIKIESITYEEKVSCTIAGRADKSDDNNIKSDNRVRKIKSRKGKEYKKISLLYSKVE